MKVLKFGGTSVGTVESLCNVKKIIEHGSDEPLVVVVSALGGITDRLIATARMAAAGDPEYVDSLNYILERHNTVINGLVPENRMMQLRNIVNPLFEELSNIYKGLSLLHDLSSRTLDIVVSYGERMSSVIIAHIIEGARHFDARAFIRTNTKWDKHTFDSTASAPLIHAALDEISATPGAVAIVSGFISTDATTRDITNLGRGGSDYTAAILAAELGARALEIWTD
ncbi:MAG: bifunctional aspartate kinase/homoserine dehydrogenase I, partial [Muribaculaceae bacterium]|nr:bifunctional aspartate kinase/homoserine dehydrogenase I [Muribaculaceae bacterium]